MTTNRMGLEQTLSDERLELLITSLIMSTAVAQQTQSFAPSFATQNELQVAALRELLAYRKASKEPVAWTDEVELRGVEKDGCGYLFKANPITPYADPRRVIMLYAAPQPKAVTVPDGWKLVPTELTAVMRDAWDSAPNGEDDDLNMRNAYRAMIAAATSVTNEP